MNGNVEELILLMSWRDSENELSEAEKSLNEFIAGADHYIKSLCYSQSNGDDLQFRDYYRLLILDVWEHCYQYDDGRNGEDPPEIRVKKWLGYRMKSVIRDYWSKRTASKFGIIGNESFDEPFEESSLFDDVEINSEKLKLGLESILKQREVDIILTHIQFNGYVPKEISEALCKEYEITEGYRRNLKSKAMSKLKEIAAKKSQTISK